MARDFDGVNEVVRYSGTPPVITEPFTVSLWFRCTSLTVTSTLFSILDNSSNNHYYFMGANGGDSGDFLKIQSRSGAVSNGIALTTTAYRVNTWEHALADFTSSSSRTCWINNGSSGSNTDNNSPANLDMTSFGRLERSSPAIPMLGSLAEPAIWNVSLTARERAALAAGMSPLLVRPASLVLYLPMVRDDDEDLIDGLSFTTNGTPTVSAHPRVYRPASTFYSFPAAPAGVTGISVRRRTSQIKPSFRSGFALDTSANRSLLGAWFPSLGPQGDTLRDVSGYGHHGALTNMDPATDWVTDKKFGYQLDFDATNDFISIPDRVGAGSKSITIIAWVRDDASSGDREVVSISDHVVLRIASDKTVDGIFRLTIGWFTVSTTATLPGDGSWHQLAYVFNGGDLEQYIYIDGVLKATGTRPDPIDWGISLGTKTHFGVHDAEGTRFLDGGLGPVLIYGRELPGAEIRKLYKDPFLPIRRQQRRTFRTGAVVAATGVTGISVRRRTNLVKPSFRSGYQLDTHGKRGLIGAWYPPLGPQGDTIQDVSGFGHPAVLSNMDPATDWVPDTKFGTSVELDGTNDFLDVAEKVGSGTDQITMLVWHANTASSGLREVATIANYFAIRLSGTNIPQGFYRATGGWVNLFATDAVTTDGSWIQIVYTYDGPAVEQKLFINGVEVASAANTATLDWAVSIGSVNGLTIGAHETQTQLYCTGKFGPTMIYKRALSAAEIRKNYIESFYPVVSRKRWAFRTGTAVAAGKVSRNTRSNPMGEATGQGFRMHFA